VGGGTSVSKVDALGDTVTDEGNAVALGLAWGEQAQSKRQAMANDLKQNLPAMVDRFRQAYSSGIVGPEWIAAGVADLDPNRPVAVPGHRWPLGEERRPVWRVACGDSAPGCRLWARPDEVTSQCQEHAPPSQAAGMAGRDGQLVGDLIEGQTEPAKAVDRNQTI
jgi:hypothetical protein